MSCGIYSILNTVNRKRYIGQSNNLILRLRDHLNKLKNNKHYNEHLQRAFSKYGEIIFEFKILEEVDSEMLDIRERVWIKYYKSDKKEFGYNKDGGGNANKCPSEDTRRKMSEAAKHRPPISDDTRRKLSIVNRIRSPESRQKISEALRNRVCSEETRRKRSKIHKGKFASIETRKKLSEAHKGHRPSSETRQKMSKAHQNISEQTRQKLRDAVKLSWKNRKEKGINNGNFS